MEREKGQIQFILIGLVVIGIAAALYFTGIIGGKKGEPSAEPGLTDQVAAASGPARSNLYPTGTLPAGTKETKISVSTNEPAYCRYSKEAGKDYNSMSSSFSYDKEKTFHSVKATNLQSNQTYTYYVRCRDMAGNRNTEDAVIRFVVGTAAPFSGSGSAGTGGSTGSGGADEIPPVLANLYPTGTLPAGTSETQMSVQTNEPAYCRYSTNPGVAYNSMTKSLSYDKEKLVHTIDVVSLEDNKIYEYYVKCRDMAGNRDTSDVVIRFGVGGVAFAPSSPTTINQDVTPPYRYDGLPDDEEDLPASTRKTLITLKTDETAICRYSDVSGMSYGQMRIFDATNALFHSVEVGGFNEGQSYKYYVKCADERNNVNTDDFTISFKVALPKDVTPPVRSNLYPDRDLTYGTTQTQISVQTNEPATCRYSNDQGVAYKDMKKSFSAKEGNIHVATVTGLQNGVYYSFFIRCKDVEGNVNPGDVMITFRVTP